MISPRVFDGIAQFEHRCIRCGTEFKNTIKRSPYCAKCKLKIIKDPSLAMKYANGRDLFTEKFSSGKR